MWACVRRKLNYLRDVTRPGHVVVVGGDARDRSRGRRWALRLATAVTTAQARHLLV